MSELALINRDSPYLTRPGFWHGLDGMSVIFKSSPSLLGEGDRPKGGGGVDGEAVAGATEPLRQPLRVCHLPETSSERI